MSRTTDPGDRPRPPLPSSSPPGYPATALATGDFIGDQFSMDVPMQDVSAARVAPPPPGHNDAITETFGPEGVRLTIRVDDSSKP